MVQTKQTFDKVKRFDDLSRSMSLMYSDNTKKGMQMGSDYQKKCIELIHEVDQEELEGYAKQLYAEAKIHYNYFKK
jgi:hypothetical protein